MMSAQPSPIPALLTSKIPVAKLMIVLGILWSGIILGFFQAESFGFSPSEIPFSFIAWLCMGFPGQLAVFVFTKGGMKRRLRLAVASLGFAFLLTNFWLAADEAAFVSSAAEQSTVAYTRDRWWPFSNYELVWENHPVFGEVYWAN